MDDREVTRQMVLSLARKHGWEKTEDQRPKLWEIAQARARTAPQQRKLMAVLCWLYFKRDVRDFAALNRVSQRITLAKNAYQYFQTGGKALEALLGELAVVRNQLEAVAEKRANQDFLGTNR